MRGNFKKIGFSRISRLSIITELALCLTSVWPNDPFRILILDINAVSRLSRGMANRDTGEEEAKVVGGVRGGR